MKELYRYLRLALVALIISVLGGGIVSCGRVHTYGGIEQDYYWGDDGGHHKKPKKPKKPKKHKKHKHHHHDD